MNVRDQCVLVTGGASGLGLAVAETLLAAGAHVLVADWHSGPLADAVRRLADRFGDRVRACQTDVRADDQAAHAVQQALQWRGSLQGLVQCAGVASVGKVLGPLGLQPLAEFERTVAVNLTGTFNMVRHAVQAMSAQGDVSPGVRGLIVNTASIAAFDGQVGQAAYAASKGGVVAMTLPLARELARWGIRVMTVAPGIMQTPMLAGLPAAVQASLGASVPCPSRTGHPEEFAALVMHLFANDYLNGEVIRLDGALRMAPR